MYGWRRASVPNVSCVRDRAWSLRPGRPDEPSRASEGFHDTATLTLPPRLTSVVAASIAAGTLSLGVSVSLAMISIRTLMSIPA